MGLRNRRRRRRTRREDAGGRHSRRGREGTVGDSDSLARRGGIRDCGFGAGDDEGGAAGADGGVGRHDRCDFCVGGLCDGDAGGVDCGCGACAGAVCDREGLAFCGGVGDVFLREGGGAGADGCVVGDHFCFGGCVGVGGAVGGLGAGAGAVGDCEGGGLSDVRVSLCVLPPAVLKGSRRLRLTDVTV